jgi:hypothetical protein
MQRTKCSREFGHEAAKMVFELGCNWARKLAVTGRYAWARSVERSTTGVVAGIRF